MEKKNLYYAYVLQNCPTIEYIVCGFQTFERIICENYSNSEFRDDDVGAEPLNLSLPGNCSTTELL
jgi:hypothetical protein